MYYINLHNNLVPFIDVFSYDFGLSSVPAFFVTLEFLTSILPIKFSIDALCLKFLHLSMHLSLLETYKDHFLMFKNVQSYKCMSLNKDNLEKLVVHCFRKK